MGDVTIEVLHLGPAHSPGDTQVWIPQWSIMIAGDIAFHDRMPPIFDGTCTSCWIETWDNALVPLNPTYVIPATASRCRRLVDRGAHHPGLGKPGAYRSPDAQLRLADTGMRTREGTSSRIVFSVAMSLPDAITTNIQVRSEMDQEISYLR